MPAARSPDDSGRPARPDRLVGPVLEWYDEHARDLPWRRPEASPWEVMVSEFMLQQTPVSRVLPVWAAWVERWPTPGDLASSPSGEAVRAWGRLGYPRRALRLHAAAAAIVAEHAGEVPAELDRLRALPGVGEYTAAAVATFGFTRRHVVLDTNVRRVLARAVTGKEHPAPSVTRAERDLGAEVLPAEEPRAARWSVAVMELGALVCTAANPRCSSCPVRDRCAWLAAGQPAYDGPARPVQAYAGTDRQVRGRLLAVLRDHEGSVGADALASAWHEPVQRERALAGLLADGLVVRAEDRFALPD